jgi:tetratricopeptide (TPR) repeat protein
MKVPEKSGGKITLTARLCYRKFAWFNTQFSFAGEHEKNAPIPTNGTAATTPDYDDAKMVFTASLHGVSAKSEKIPDLPIVAVAQNEVAVEVLPANAPAPKPKTQLVKEDWQRWNDYGIGLFLQGDLKAAQAAFEKVTEVDPQNPDGWVNIGRAALQEGDVSRARIVLEKALALSPDLARAHFFYAGVLRQEGDYDGAAQHLNKVLAQYPRDRVALNNLGRVLFLERKYSDAVKTLQQVLAVDPEDLQAHYNLMLCYNGLGNEKMSKEHQARYLRFKADESAQAITGPYRQLNPEDNNERQNIHEHVSVSLPIFTARTGTTAFVRPAKPNEAARVATGVSPVRAERSSAGVRGSAGSGAQK